MTAQLVELLLLALFLAALSCWARRRDRPHRRVPSSPAPARPSRFPSVLDLTPAPRGQRVHFSLGTLMVLFSIVGPLVLWVKYVDPESLVVLLVLIAVVGSAALCGWLASFAPLPLTGVGTGLLVLIDLALLLAWAQGETSLGPIVAICTWFVFAAAFACVTSAGH